VAPSRSLKGGADTSTFPKSGFVASVVFRQPEGTVRAEGLEMTYQHSMAADPPIQLGEEIIVFLTDSDGSGTCALPSALLACSECKATRWLMGTTRLPED